MHPRYSKHTSHGRVLHVSTNTSNGTNAGVFARNVNNSSANRNRNIASRLARSLGTLFVGPTQVGKDEPHKSLVGATETLGSNLA